MEAQYRIVEHVIIFKESNNEFKNYTLQRIEPKAYTETVVKNIYESKNFDDCVEYYRKNCEYHETTRIVWTPENGKSTTYLK